MNEERLQEIKDSVDFQREMLLAHNLGTLCVDEEQELIDEIERLKEQLNDEIDDELKQSEIMVKKQEEIQRLKDDNKYLNKVNIELSSEKNRLHSIIKEVREYLNNHIEQWNNVEEFINVVEEDEYILSLLDKENNNV